MSPNRWILLLIFYISYLLFGAAIYYHIEHGEEKEARAEELKERIEIHDYLLEQLSDKNETTQDEILERITDYCGKPVTDYTKDEYEIPYTWTFYHAFFFAFTVCSTVGYGNISPTTFAGRMVMIVYSVIGIPVNGILFAGLGEYFGKTFEAIYRRYKKYKMSSDDHYVPPQLGLITTVVIALIPGIALFLLLPAWVFTYFENWPYSISLYYSYVTTSTIGFGDYVPTFGANQPREFGGWFVVYQIFVIVWFIFSLGYLVMIMTFITRGLQSKKLAHLEQQLSSNLKATQNRIWTGVTKDVGYLRRLLNELYILKVKPVYSDTEFAYNLPRSASCPELSMYRVEPAPIPSRKRAYSVCAELASGQSGGLVHANSDTELSKFDREKTFETAEAYRQTTDLLAKVVTALATVQPPPPPEADDAPLYGGYHGFSDSQILASEWSFSTLNEFSTPRRPRGRACSDFNIEPPRRPLHRAPHNHNEWTWSGDNQQIQEAFRNRYKGQLNGAASDSYVVHLEPDHLEEQLKKSSTSVANGRVKKFSMPDGLRNASRTWSAGWSGDLPASTGPYQRRSAAAAAAVAAGKRRRESIYTQNPALAARRGSMYPPTAAAQLAQMQRRGSGSAAMAAVAARRGSLFPATSMGGVGATPRRSSIFSVTSDKDMDVLEQTTIADLIRALEVVHTHAVLDEQQQLVVGNTKLSKKQRKMGNAGLDPPQLPPILSLFAGDQTRSLQATAANRLYARRSTIVGTMSPMSSSSSRRPSGVQMMEPPPSYTEKPLVGVASTSTPTVGQSKFRRRFSVRPTALQIPPGQAPPPGVSLSDEPSPAPLVQSSASQTALQRRLSLRPSPLARELSPTSPTGASGPLASGPDEAAPSAARLLPTSSISRPSTSSTHSPLSRIVQISQAQRKSSMPEGFPGAGARKPSGNASGSGSGSAGNDK
ncbi:open rectifier potassium channel protein 1 [Drosophila innubila]|uniref:open rectifier potassium channel protein 1 n=1 Tax=Drosophila innubila TaxID=198719 RepID=UPI00148D196F|nr:open rectifier potassium channel protein 1 [Drosophila innubila]